MKKQLPILATAAFVLGMAAAPAAAQKLKSLGQPCRAKQILAGRVIVDRADHRERLVLTNDNETQGLELLFVDYEKNAGQMFVAPAGAGSWALNEVPGDRLVVGTFYDGTFIVFDLAQMKYIKTAKFPGEDYIWNLAIGKDGRVYGGTYPGGKLGAMDLTTYAVEDRGAPAPPNLYLRSVSATPTGLILCSFGQEKPTTLLYDPATKRFSAPPASLEGVTAGAAWSGYFLANDHAFEGDQLKTVRPLPFPAPPAEKGSWSVDAYLTTPDVALIKQGNAYYRFKKGDQALSLIAEIDLRGGRLMAGDSRGEVLGVRGQDYFVIKPGDRDLELRPVPVEGRGRPMLFLKAGPDGRLWGGPHFGQTLFWLDPQTKKFFNTGTVCDAGGEVYDVAFLDGKIYTASYAGGDITCYDPAHPWDQWNLKNPRPVAKVGPAYIRPTGGILAGPNGKLYSGWMAKYETYGGAMAIADPATGQTELIENPLGAQGIVGLAIDKGYGYIGTSLEGNGLPKKKGESPQFGIVDLAAKKAVFRAPFEGAEAVHSVVFDIKTGRVAMLVDKKLRIFDARKKAFADVPISSVPKITAACLAAPGQGFIYAGAGRDAIRIDLKTGAVKVLVQAPAAITNITVDGRGAVYIACEADVYRID
jgi:outer membrane protein assembly factor BamB